MRKQGEIERTSDEAVLGAGGWDLLAFLLLFALAEALHIWLFDMNEGDAEKK